MNSFDFSLIEEQDPSLGKNKVLYTYAEAATQFCALTAEGHRVLYDREVPFEIRNQIDPHDTTQEVSSIIYIQCKS